MGVDLRRAMKTRTTKRWCEWKRVCRPFVFKMKCCGMLLVMAYSITARILQALCALIPQPLCARIPQALCAALLILVEPYVIHQYSKYKMQLAKTEPTLDWNPFQSYSTEGESWYAPWTSSVGVTAMFVLMVMSFIVAYRIDHVNSFCTRGVYITVVVSHALYWCIYIYAKTNGLLGYIVCTVFVWFAIISRELFSVYGGNGFTEMNISETKKNSLRTMPKLRGNR